MSRLQAVVLLEAVEPEVEVVGVGVVEEQVLGAEGLGVGAVGVGD